LYDSKATHEELGADFFPEGSQRVYVSLSRDPESYLVPKLTAVGIAGKNAKSIDQNHASSSLAGHHGTLLE
jgi:hypothetical protein